MAGAVGLCSRSFCGEIVDGRKSSVVFCARVQTGEEFVLSFVHP
jgi:hypothetical protein